KVNLDLTTQERSMTELYVFPPSPRAFKVMAFANYLGIEPTLHMLDLIKGEQKSPQYAALNPNMRMPTLKDGDYVLWESNAILQYLAAKRPQSGLLPTDEKARLDVTRWQFWDLAHWIRPARCSFSRTWSNRSCLRAASQIRRRSPRPPNRSIALQ